MSDANRQHVHRQQDNGQDDHAAKGGSDPGFGGLVHAVTAAAKRRGGRCRRSLRHWFRPLSLIETMLTKRARHYDVSQTAGSEMLIVYEIDGPDVWSPQGKRKDSWNILNLRSEESDRRKRMPAFIPRDLAIPEISDAYACAFGEGPRGASYRPQQARCECSRQRA
jgi:hypothetical protein